MKTNIHEITDNIKRWNQQRNTPTLLPTLKPVRELEFQLDDLFPNSSDIHVYPGLTRDGKLHIYLISAHYDTSEYEGDLENYIVDATIYNELSHQDPIPTGDARQRILNWSDHFDLWFNSTIEQKLMFQAFLVPQNDLPGLSQDIKAYWALYPNLSDEGASYIPDLIVTSGSEIIFEDTVMPVPPFGLRNRAAAAFFLLGHSLGK